MEYTVPEAIKELWVKNKETTATVTLMATHTEEHPKGDPMQYYKLGEIDGAKHTLQALCEMVTEHEPLGGMCRWCGVTA